MNTNQQNHEPQQEETLELIGPAKPIAIALIKTAEVLRKNVKSPDWKPLKKKSLNMVFHGSSGTGKTTIVNAFANALLGEDIDYTLVGNAVVADTIKDWTQQAAYCVTAPSGIVVKIINEVDKVYANAQCSMLQFLDEAPNDWVILGTTNAAPDFTQPFWSRWRAVKVAKPTNEEVSTLLIKKFALDRRIADRIALESEGNVRTAINKAEVYILTGNLDSN